MIKLHEIQERSKEQNISDQKKHIENLSAKIEELKDVSDFNQILKNKDIKKEIKHYEEKIMGLNKIVSDKNEKLKHI